MKELINLYKNISLEILELFNKEDIDNNKLDKLLDNRENILENLDDDKLKIFAEHYVSNNLNEIDKRIKFKFTKKMIETQLEINNYKKNKQMNTAYININKKNLNLFSKKV
ncbi:MAG: hypothetical protein IJ086_02265 [Clostridium sp.]|nr:hypothetical protein [Clostridium sp.]